MFHCFRLGSNPDKLFPYSALENQLQKCGKFALASASFLLPIMMAEADLPMSNDPSSNDGNQTLNENNTQKSGLSKALNKRMRDIVADMHRLGYI